MDFKAGYLEITPKELVRYLLRESGQQGRDAVNPAEILDFLKLNHTSFNFGLELPEGSRAHGTQPRALLSFPDRLVAIDQELSEHRARFSVLHEIAHYILPSHEYFFYLCDDRGLSEATGLEMEKQANDFAADLLFQDDRFTLEANSHVISAGAIKNLATKYKASFESTARRIIEKNIQPCMLMVFQQTSIISKINIDSPSMWTTKYCIASTRFRTDYFTKAQGLVPEDVVKLLTATGRDISDSVQREITVTKPDGKKSQFEAEFFYNSYNIFCLLRPIPDS